MQECRVCGLLFLGGGACPSCGSQVAVDVNTDDIVMDDESIPGLDDIADAIGDTEDEDTSNADVLPFGMGAKAEVIQSSLPFGVGSFSDSVTEVAIPIGEQDYEEETVVTEQNVEAITEVEEEQVTPEPASENFPESDEESQIVQHQNIEPSFSEPIEEESVESEDLAPDIRVTEEIPVAVVSLE
ncbi:MAG: hypothetical protein ACPHA0_05135, partial [Candidatus Poseidoniaceae archaeon]